MSGRHRHPSAWRPDLGALTERLVAELRSRDSPWPEAGTAALVARGLAGAERRTWAAACGLDEAVVARAEAGLVPADDLPDPLRRRLRPAPGGDGPAPGAAPAPRRPGRPG